MNAANPAVTEAAPIPQRQWSLLTTLLFRYAFVFFVIFSLVFSGFPIALLQVVPDALLAKLGIAEQVTAFWKAFGEDPGLAALGEAWSECVGRFGDSFLGFTKTYDPAVSGSGDKFYDWAQITLVALIAVLPALFWSLADSRRRCYPRLARLLWIAARLFLASVMFGYGFAKVVKTQFPLPSLLDFVQPFGDQSPMGLVWRFMGISTAYTVFAGGGEVLGGILLCFRRTATLGALVVIAVMINVCMINYAYDVPVKLYATYYVVLASAIALPDASRLLAVLVLNRPAPARDLSGPFASAWANHGVTLLTLVWMTCVCWANIEGGLTSYKGPFGDGRVKSPLYGVYEVESFVKDGTELPPLATDRQRWKRFISDYPTFLHVYLMDGSLRAYTSEIDPLAHTITLFGPKVSNARGRLVSTTATKDPAAEPPVRYTWTYSEIEPNLFRFDGQLSGHTYSIRARRRTDTDFELTKRGFHWISPFPYNR